jgi:hypothetical protein
MAVDTRDKSIGHPEASPDRAAEGDDRRAWPRVPAERLASVAARLATGSEVTLIDLSRGGARIETDKRMLPNSSVALKLIAADSAFVITGRVVRSRVIRLAQGGLGYDVAMSFNEPLQNFAELPQPAATAAPAAASLPAAVATAPAVLSLEPSAVGEPPELLPDPGALDDVDSGWPTAMIHVTATVGQTPEELIDLFDVSNW